MANVASVMNIVVNNGLKHIHITDLVNIQMTNKDIYIALYPVVNEKYKEYVGSDLFKSRMVKTLNYYSYMIDAFDYNSRILTNMMFEYVMTCYDNWHWLSMNDSYRSSINLPTTTHFERFLAERNLTIDDILPKARLNYTHHHRPTKTFSYYKTI